MNKKKSELQLLKIVTNVTKAKTEREKERERERERE
jgi:hypothetical protein